VNGNLKTYDHRKFSHGLPVSEINLFFTQKTHREHLCAETAERDFYAETAEGVLRRDRGGGIQLMLLLCIVFYPA
jgi:hypothetical protein